MAVSMRNAFLPCVALLLCAGCDPGYPPVIANGTHLTLQIDVSFCGVIGSTSGTLGPGGLFVQRRKGLAIRQLVVKIPGAEAQVITEADLGKARAEQLRPGKEVWLITAQGVRMADRNDLRKLRELQRSHRS